MKENEKMKDFFSDQPELSADLEWMLQSGQAEKDLLAETLIAEAYTPVYRLALALLEDEETAQEAAIRTFRSALLNLEGYRSDRGVQAWLFRIELGVCREFLQRQGLSDRLKRIARRPVRLAPSPPGTQEDLLIWLEMDRLPLLARVAVILRALFKYEPAEIAAISRQSEGQVQTRLAVARLVFQDVFQRTSQHPASLDGEEVDRRLARFFESRWPPVQLTPGEQRWVTEAVLRDLDRAGARRMLSISASEFALVGAIAVLVIGLIWGANRFLPEPEPTNAPRTTRPTAKPTAQPQPTQTPRPTSNPSPSPTQPVMMSYFASPGESLRSIAASLGVSLDDLAEYNKTLAIDEILDEARGVEVPLGPVLPSASPTAIRPPVLRSPELELSSSSQEIYTKLLLSERLWSTLWADAEIINYGPAGYVGQSLWARELVWYSQPGKAKVLIGPMAGKPRYHWITSGGLFYYKQPGILRGYMNQAPDNFEIGLIRDLIFPGRASWIHEDGKFQAIGEEQDAGRETTVVDWYNAQNIRERRLWIDRITGVILLQHRFNAKDGQTLEETIHITHLAFDVSLEPDLFDPRQDWTSGFAVDHLGHPIYTEQPESADVFSPAPGHEPLAPEKTPPPGFDLGSSRLTFQYPGNSAVETTPVLSNPTVELFAGEYFLGQVPFARPWGVRCARSPDGLKLAFVSQSHWLEFNENWEPAKLRWFSLSEPSQTDSPIEAVDPGDFAFAPDSQRLAFFAQQPDGGALYILDTQTGEAEILAKVQSAFSLVWSPNGEHLALIGSAGYSDDMLAMILHARTGQVVYTTPVDLTPYRWTLPGDFGPDWPALSWPAHNWGVQFPVFERSLKDCTEPPATSP